MLLHRGLGAKHGGKSSRAEYRMRVRMAGRIGMEPRTRRLIGHNLLRIAGHRIIFRKACQYRRAFAPFGDKGGRHAARAFFNREALSAQKLNIIPAGFVFPPGGFGMRPNAFIEARKPRLVGRDPVKRNCADGLVCVHDGISFRLQDFRTFQKVAKPS